MESAGVGALPPKRKPMKVFGRDRHRHDSPWDGAPAWALELYEIGLVQLHQNDIQIKQNSLIVELLKKLKPQTSPEDQRVMNQIYDKAVEINKKIDAAGVE